MAKVFKIMVPDNSLILRTLYNDSMIHYMYSDDFHPEIVKVELPSVTYKYNKKTGELTQDYGLDDNPYDLTDYSDIAYEGYSRLSLGLED